MKMKKLILLFAFLLGSVGDVTATTKRIFLKAENGWGVVNIYLYYGSSDTNITGGWPGMALTRIGTTQWFYGDVNSDEAEAKCIVSSDGWGQTKPANSDLAYYTIDLSNNNVIYLYNDGSNNENGNRLSIVTFTGYVIANSDRTKLCDLTQEGLVLSGDVDFSSAPSNKNFAIFPSFTANEDGVEKYVWDVALRPKTSGDFELNNFQTYNDDVEYKGYEKTWYDNMNMKYSVSVDMSTLKFTFTPYVSRTFTTASDKYLTFSSDYNVAVPDGVTAYYASSSEEGRIYMAPAGDGIHQNDAVFLAAEEAKEYKFTPASTTPTDRSSSNLLKKPTTLIPATSGSTYRYVFAKQGGNLGFYNVGAAITDVSKYEGKAYLEVSDAGSRYLQIWLNGEPAGISIPQSDEQTLETGVVYDLQGRRVEKPTKGLYIVNGHKVVIK